MKHLKGRRCLSILSLCLILFTLFPALPKANAQEGTTVRVGWHEAPYYYVDEYGRRFGYSYEYQQKVAAYTGWNYEYVEASWGELMQMLLDGEIDLMANVSYTEERARSILYSSLPMGAETYYVFVPPRDTDISSENDASLNGKTVGVARGSIQSQLFRQWAAVHNVRVNLVEMSTTEEESLLQLGQSLDAFVTMDGNVDPKAAVPVWKIGSSDFFFALSGKRGDLLPQLNAALSRIQDENMYYSQQLNEKYLRRGEAERFLTTEERAWLTEHGAIRVGYQDDYLAFCARDAATGELTGTLRDYLDYAATALENVEISFEAIAYPTAAAALEALENGEIDCMFPANFIPSDAESLGLVMTPALMQTEMDAVVRAAEQKEFGRREQVTVAVNRGNTNYEMFLRDQFPTWDIAYFDDTPAGLRAVAAGGADCVLISNYRFSSIAKLCESLDLSTVYTGVDMDYYFAARRGDTLLYSILARVARAVPASMVHAALTYYSAEEARTSFFDHVRVNLTPILLGALLVVLVILLLLLRSIRAEKKATADERVISDLNKQVYVDALTHVRNRGGYDHHIQELQARLEQGEALEFAICVFDCDDLKGINDRHGHDKGNLYLTAACRLICKTFQHSPVFRIGGDEFAAILSGDDYRNRAALLQQLEAAERESRKSPNKWDQVSIAAGLAEYDPALDQTVSDTARRADQRMYENKRQRKSGR